jgi:hypothetical protein
MLPDSEDPPFAFDIRQMPVMERPAEARPDSPVLPPPHRVLLDEPPPRRARWWVPALVSLFLGAIGGISYEMGALPRDRQWTELHLDAHTDAGRLEITWDAKAPTVLNAVRGQLTVTDGGAPREIRLSSAQVRAGKFSLTAWQPDVGVRLVLYAPDGAAVGDAIRVAFLPQSIPMPEDRQPSVPALSASAAPAAPQRQLPTTPPPQQYSAIAVPPSTLREVQPRIPEGIRSRIAAPVIIPVEVKVSDQGRVLRAVAEVAEGDNTDGVHRYLAGQAQKAAREWRFKPARTKSGATIAASKTIQFVFNP